MGSSADVVQWSPNWIFDTDSKDFWELQFKDWGGLEMVGIEKKDPWANRQEVMRCETCIWCVVKGSSGKIGRCRRHAPSMGGFPVIFVMDDWCGDHRLDETKA